MFTVNQRINVPGKPGIQGVIQSRREPQVFTTPAVTVLNWIDEDGISHSATFNDGDLCAANPAPARDPAAEMRQAVAGVRVESFARKPVTKKKPASKSKRK